MKKSIKKNGFTLVELIVAFGLFSIIVAVASGGFIQIIRSYRVAAALMAANDSMALTIEQMAREMRTGYNFCKIADSLEPKIQFVNANNEVVRYRLNSSGNSRAIERAVSDISAPVNFENCSNADDQWFNYEPITATNVAVAKLNIVACGNNISLNIPLDPCGSLTTRPRITLAFSITSAEPEVEKLGIFIDAQTTISARNIAELPAPAPNP